MSRIDLELDEDVVLDERGCIYDSMDPEYLCEDMLEIDLRTGITIEVGWAPEGDPSGAFRITVFRDYWTNKIGEDIRAEDPVEAARWVQFLVAVHGDSGFQGHHSSSHSTDLTYDPKNVLVA